MVEKKHKRIGTLAPIFSLTSSELSSADQGTFEAGLYFLDWLSKTEQTAWQILPLNETQLEKDSATKHVPSPYKGYGVGLAPKYLSSAHAKIKPTVEEKNAFIVKHKEWIEDYALFCSIRDFYGTDDWRTWDKRLRTRQKGALTEWAKKYKAQIDYYIVLQWQLHTSYERMHNKAKEQGIWLISDLPYYLSVQSPLVWAHQNAFRIDPDGGLSTVSGIPNTAGTHFGRQVWGHPLYNWERKDEVIHLWKLRLAYQTMLFEDVRLDHAKGFFSYGVMEVDNEANDRYEDGPGDPVFRKIFSYGLAAGLEMFAEDSGDKTMELRACLQALQVPGIKVFSYALKDNDYIVNQNYAEMSNYPQNCVAYTSTHDTVTLLGQLKGLNKEQKKMLAQASAIELDEDDKVFAARIRDAIVASQADTIIIPIQDWLLTTDRINVPGTEKEIGDTNWQFLLDRTIEELPETL